MPLEMAEVDVGGAWEERGEEIQVMSLSFSPVLVSALRLKREGTLSPLD